MRFYTLFLFLLILALVGCKKDDAPTGDNFNRSAWLEKMADEQILPRLAQLQEATAQLAQRTASLNADSDAAAVEATQKTWLEAALNYEQAASLTVGPGAENITSRSIPEAIGPFPVDAPLIDKRIEHYSQIVKFPRATRGLFALEYLLFSFPDGELALCPPTGACEDKISYLKDLGNLIRDYCDDVYSEWTVGDYRSDFIAADGTSVKSSTTQLYNGFLQTYEATRDLRLAAQRGILADQSSAHPEWVEAYYSGQSLPLLRANVRSLYQLYIGQNTQGEEAAGWEDYLSEVEGGSELAQRTREQFENVLAVLERIPESAVLSDLIREEAAILVELQTELDQLEPLLKSEMSSLLGLAITATTADGD